MASTWYGRLMAGQTLNINLIFEYFESKAGRFFNGFGCIHGLMRLELAECCFSYDYIRA